MKLLLDSCVSRDAPMLRAAGHDVLSVSDWENDPGDEQILEFALKEGRTVVTLDKDFDFALPDESRGELRGPALFACGAAQDERVAAVLDDRIRRSLAVRARNLSDRLEAEHAAAAEFAQASERQYPSALRVPSDWVTHFEGGIVERMAT